MALAVALGNMPGMKDQILPGHRHHLHPDLPGLAAPGGGHGPVLAPDRGPGEGPDEVQRPGAASFEGASRVRGQAYSCTPTRAVHQQRLAVAPDGGSDGAELGAPWELPRQRGGRMTLFVS